jgi:transcriptional regulator with XRE-family HTH domain
MDGLYRPPGHLSAKPVGIEQESFGRRVGKRRAELGWTQAQLAARVGVSRVALSHIESGATVASERTVALLASVFGCEPPELVAGTDYPIAKAERLPAIVARHTEVDHQLAVLTAVLEIVERVPRPEGARLVRNMRDTWRPRLLALRARNPDPDERRRLSAALRDLAALGAVPTVRPEPRDAERSSAP